MLESQKRANYVNEYDRLRGAVLSGLVKECSIKHINLRIGKLKELASESIHGKNTIFSNLKRISRKLTKNWIQGHQNTQTGH